MALSGTTSIDGPSLIQSGDYFRALVSGRARGLWPSLQRAGLWALSVPYGWATGLKNRLYEWGWKRSGRAPAGVVSVGNLTLGGTGKTPCVEYVARYYQQRGWRVAILSRGYGSETGCNDEARLLAENLPDVPHLQGADRMALAAVAVEELRSEVLVLDDGFQHRRLSRDLDIVLVDATEPWGHGRLFPSGLLRESPRGLRRAGIVLLTRCDQVDAAQVGRLREEVARLAPGVPVVETTHRPVELINAERQTAPLDLVAVRPIAAFCGIGNPEAFRQTLQALGGSIASFRSYPDHHAYTRNDVEDLQNWARRLDENAVVLTTQKDLVKVRQAQLGGRDLWALRIRLQIEIGEEELDRELGRVLSNDE